MPTRSSPPAPKKRTYAQQIAERLQTLRLRRGWNMDRVAAAAGISRTTLFHLEHAKIAKPRAPTLHSLAQVFQVPVDDLVSERESAAALLREQSAMFPGELPQPAVSGPAPARLRKKKLPRGKKKLRAFDRASNPLVTAVAAAEPELFKGWGDDDWTELYSTFATGGALNEEGVRVAARRIGRNRDTADRLRVILQTHLADVAEQMVDTLFRMVVVAPAERSEPKRIGSGSSDE